MSETWKDVVGFEGLYRVSDQGRVYSLKTNRYLRPHSNVERNGYMCLILRKGGKSYGRRVHRLVAEAFIGNPHDFPAVNHKDENPTNNRAGNLEWCTNQYNNLYGTRIERKVSHTNYEAVGSLQAKPVRQIGKTGETIKVWKSANECKRALGYDNSRIAHCCRGTQKTAYGFRWEYAG